jgi:hypothetical protein
MLDCPEIQVAAARYVLGVATGNDLVWAADRAVDRDHITPSLAELASRRSPIMSDAGPLFEMALRELQWTLPDRDTATWHVIRHHVGRIARGETPPRTGIAAVIREVEQNPKSTLRCIRWVGDSHDLQNLIGAYYGFDDLEARPDEVSCEGKYGREAVEALENHMIGLARKWIAEHGGWHGQPDLG